MGDADSARWNSLALRLVLGLTGLRLLWHLAEPIGLLGDEAYYWEWGRHLDWGYFSKPPLIAWLYGLVGRLTGDSLYAFKATATLLTGGGLSFFFLAVRRAFDARLAFWALAASALSIGNTLLASILTIDAPLLFCWCLALWLYFDLLFAKEKPSWRTTLLLALALGCGHLSKQMMLAFLPLMFAGAWFVQRNLLRKPHLYVASALSLLFLLPPFFWNMSHDWVTVSHTGHHFEAEKFDPGEIVVRYAELFGVTALLLTPIFFVLMLGAIWSVRRWSSQPARIRMLFVFGAAALLAIGLLALRQEINPNWPAVFYPAAIAMTTWWCLNGDAPRRAAWFRRSVVLGAAFTAALMLLLPVIDKLGIPAQRRGWRGYEQLAREIEAAHDLPATAVSSNAQNGPEPAANNNRKELQVIVQGHRFNASQIAYYLRNSADVYLSPTIGKVDSQYDFWPGPDKYVNALLVIERKNETREGKPYPDLANAFNESVYLREVSLHPSRDYPKFRIYRAYKLKDWPASVENK